MDFSGATTLMSTFKSAMLFQVLRQVRGRGDSAIVYDPAREFVKRFYDPSRGDVILNPLDKRCSYWGEERLRSSSAKALAASLFQPPQDRKGEFFIESPQKIFAFLMAYGPTPDELVQWMSNPDEIDRRLKGTEHAHLIDPRAHQQRAGVLGSLGLVAGSLRLLPKRAEGNGAWTATEWAEKRQGWIFITSLPAEHERFLAGGGLQVAGDPASKHLYMVDESSLASTQQMSDFLNKIAPQDRVLLIGDTRQHQGVHAGKPFEQLQEADMRTAQLDQIMRPKDPELLKAVEHLSNNETTVGIEMLSQQGRITQIVAPRERIAAIAKSYADHPENMLVVSPDAPRRSSALVTRFEGCFGAPSVATEMKAVSALI